MKKRLFKSVLFSNDLFLLLTALGSVYYLIFALNFKPKSSLENEIFYIAPEGDFSKRVILVSPQSDSVAYENSASFTWENYANNVKTYQFQLSRNQSFSDLFLERDLSKNNLDLHIGEPSFYFWRVRAVSNEGEISPWSLKSCLLLGPLNVTFNAPVPIKPFFERVYFENLETIKPIYFKWEQELLNESCFVYPESYNLQIAKEASFESLVYNLNSATSSFTLTDTTELLNSLPKGSASVVFYWRVLAVDSFEKLSPWSDVAAFTLTNKNVSVF